MVALQDTKGGLRGVRDSLHVFVPNVAALKRSFSAFYFQFDPGLLRMGGWTWLEAHSDPQAL